MKLIVCGATGYVGRRLITRARGRIEALPTSSRAVPGHAHLDLLAPDEAFLARLQPGDVLALAAAVSSPDICSNDFERAWALNVTATGELVRRALAAGTRVIFLASDTVYGEQPEPFDERCAGRPAGPYARMKRALELRFEGHRGFKSLRLSYVFSKDDKFTRYLADCHKSGQPAELFHPFLRSVVHRDDVVDAVIALALRWDEFPDAVLNVGGPQTISRVEFADTLRTAALPGLQVAVTEPDDAFFEGRPRRIAMRSPLLPALLGRPPRSLAQAAALEFDPQPSLT